MSVLRARGVGWALSLILFIASLRAPLVSSAPRKRAGGLYSRWTYAHATFYGGFRGEETNSGACGYRDVQRSGYGKYTAAASSALWRLGHSCGACMQVICVNTRTWRFCHKGYPSITVTVTNMCPQDWYKDSNKGGWCNNPRKHLDMSVPAFLKLAVYRAGIVPIVFRRVPCVKKGGIVIATHGNYWWLEINIQNQAGSGDARRVYFRRTGGRHFVMMKRSWGATYARSGIYVGVPLDLVIQTLYTGESLYIPNALPRGWKNGKKYTSNRQFSIPTSFARKLIAGKVQFDPDQAPGRGMTTDSKEWTMDSDSKLVSDMMDQKLSTDTSDDLLDAASVNFQQDRLYPNASDIIAWEKGQDVDEEFKRFLLN